MAETNLNRNLVTALIAVSDGDIDEIADNLGIDAGLLERSLNDYDSLSRREQTILESAVTTHINVDLDENNPALAEEIHNFADQLEKPDMFVDGQLQDYFHTLVANGQIDIEHFEQFAGMFVNLSFLQAQNILEAIGKGELTAEDLANAYIEDEGDIDARDSEFWEIARDYLDTE